MICFKTLHKISTSQPLHFTGPFNVKLDHDTSSHLTIYHKSSSTVIIRPTDCPSELKSRFFVENRIEIDRLAKLSYRHSTKIFNWSK